MLQASPDTPPNPPHGFLDFVIITGRDDISGWLQRNLSVNDRFKVLSVPDRPLSAKGGWGLRKAPGDRPTGVVATTFTRIRPHLMARLARSSPDLKVVFIVGPIPQAMWLKAAREALSAGLNIEDLPDSWFIGRFESPRYRDLREMFKLIGRWAAFVPAASMLILDESDVERNPATVVEAVGRHIQAERDPAKSEAISSPRLTRVPMRRSLSTYFSSISGGLTSLSKGKTVAGVTSYEVPQTPSLASVYARDFSLEWYRPGEMRKLHLGCGENVLPGWLNVDQVAQPWDGVFPLALTAPIFLADESFDVIYLPDLVNRLPYREGVDILHECLRILKPGGRLRLCALDPQFVGRLLAGNFSEELSRYVVCFTEENMPHVELYSASLVASRMLAVNKTLYDWPTLSIVLDTIGFKNITRAAIGQSQHACFVGIDDEGKYPDGVAAARGLVVEAAKSGRPHSAH
jgi:hypothetical protein